MIDPKILELLSGAIQKIPESPFLASQALTCKIENILRDHLYFIMSSHEEYELFKEVKLNNNRTLCDLVLYRRGDKQPLLAIELKQYYSEDIVYSENMRKQIVDVLIKDSQKYKEVNIPVLNVLFIVHMECTQDAYREHGDKFKYYKYFKSQRESDEFNKQLKPNTLAFMDKLDPSQKLRTQFLSLGEFKDIKVDLLTTFFQFG